MAPSEDNEHLTMLRDTLRRFIENEMPRDRVSRWDKENRFPRDVHDKHLVLRRVVGGDW